MITIRIKLLTAAGMLVASTSTTTGQSHRSIAMPHHNDSTEDHADAEFTMLPDEVYNIIATLHEKSQGLAAYE